MSSPCIALVVLCLGAALASAQPNASALNEAYKKFDMERREGLGYSTSSDSGTLGWGEGQIIQDYAYLWEATQDT